LNSHYLILNDSEALRRIDNIYGYKIKKGDRLNRVHPDAHFLLIIFNYYQIIRRLDVVKLQRSPGFEVMIRNRVPPVELLPLTGINLELNNANKKFPNLCVT